MNYLVLVAAIVYFAGVAFFTLSFISEVARNNSYSISDRDSNQTLISLTLSFVFGSLWPVMVLIGFAYKYLHKKNARL